MGAGERGVAKRRIEGIFAKGGKSGSLSMEEMGPVVTELLQMPLTTTYNL